MVSKSFKEKVELLSNNITVFKNPNSLNLLKILQRKYIFDTLNVVERDLVEDQDV